MPEMEKGRPPENKRSRKPAHPVKREINQEMKTFAESTMNELLGWYGYDKVELRDSEATEIRGYPNRDRRQQHVSVLKENAVSKPKSLDSKASPSALAMRSGERESSSVPSSSSSSSSPSSSLTSPKEHKSAPVIVPLIKPSAVEDVQNVQIVCVWCQKEGVKRYSLCMGSELKSFCSEKCFAACRRAYFKRNKARDEDLHGERSPQRPHPDDSPRLVLKMNSGARSLSPVPQVCDWCKHIRHTKEYLDFGSGEERLQFCSTKCLNQYKMDVFYREARAALTSSSPGGAGGAEGKAEGGAGGQKLLTPESWSSGGGGGAGDARQRTLSPKGPTPIHGTAAPTSVSPSEASSSSSKVPVAGLRPPERLLPPPPPPPLSEAGPRPSPLPPRPHHMEHHHPPLPQIPIPFIRPPLHAQGLKSPLAAAHPPRHPGPPSSPIHRPPHSPHLQPPSASSMNPPGLMHPYPGAYFPGLHSPPINMMPRGPAPFPPPPMMNFGIPSFAPLLPQPTVLVPYPIIIPFPVPIPIPVPFPVPRRGPPDPPAHGGVIQPVPEGGAERGRSRGARQPSPGAPVAGSGRTPVQGPLSPHGRDADWVKSERQRPSPASTPRGGESSPGPRYNGPLCSAPEGPTDSKPVLQNQNQQQQPERQVIQRLQRTQVKQEPGPQGPVDSSGPGEPDGGEQGGGARAGHYDGVRPPRSPSHDSVYRRDANSPSPRATPSPAGGGPPDDGTDDAPTSLDEQNRATSSLDRPPSPDSSSPSSSSSPSPSQPPIPAPPPDPAPSELEAVKENQGRAGIGDAPPRPEEPPAAGGDGDDAHIPDEDHAYALPTAPRPAATPAAAPAAPAALLLPKLRDKGALRSPPPPAAGAGVVGGGDTEPALKRRCLRIRDQNK